MSVAVKARACSQSRAARSGRRAGDCVAGYSVRMGIRVDGSTGENVTSCTSCGELIYHDLRAMRNHDIANLGDGRTRLFSRDLGLIIHLCSDEQMGAQVERVVTEATSILV